MNSILKTSEGRRKIFFRSVKYGPIFICVCCHRSLFEHSVQLIKGINEFICQINNLHTKIFENAIGYESLKHKTFGQHYICFTCTKYINKGKIPPMSNKNGLGVFDSSHPKYVESYDYLRNLTELENCLIAKNILFMKMFALPKSRISAFKDRIVNVPISIDDINKTIKSLPRTPSEAGIVLVKFKRKQSFKNSHIQQYVSAQNIKKALLDLKKLGHKHYQDVSKADLDIYFSRCDLEDSECTKVLFGINDDLINLEQSSEHFNRSTDILSGEQHLLNDFNVSNKTECIKTNVNLNINIRIPSPLSTDIEEVLDSVIMESSEKDIEDEIEKDLDEYLKNDPVARFQFDYNHSTCFGNEVPEISAVNDAIAVAPGEGKIPKSLLLDPDWDMKSHPSLDPTGENNLNRDRKVSLSAQTFFEQRILNADKRFANSMSYVFAAVQYCESKQLNSNVNISFLRGKSKRSNDGGLTYSLDDPCSVFDSIKNTPRYWKKKKDELIAKLENLGPFHFFFTLSCADMRYQENFTSLLQEHKIVYEEEKGKEKAYIFFNGTKMTVDDFLKLDTSKHEFIRKNILTATRNFNQRVKSFIKNIVMSKESEMCVEYYNYRVEFQLRGAGHIHGVLWVDLDHFIDKQFKDPNSKISFSELKNAFKSVNNDESPSPEHCQMLQDFSDLFISVSLKTPGGKIAGEVNRHHHTRTCRKRGTTCRFNFPRFPSVETILSIPTVVKFPDPENREANSDKSKLVLRKVKDVLEDEHLMAELCMLHQTDIEQYMLDLEGANNEEDERLFINSKSSSLKRWKKDRIIALLKVANISSILEVNENLPSSDYDDQLLAGYTEMLSISHNYKYTMIIERDID